MDLEKKRNIALHKKKYMQRKKMCSDKMPVDELKDYFNILPNLKYEDAIEELRKIRRGL